MTTDEAIIQAAKVTAGAIMIAFAVLGLLVGYIVTSTWYERRLQKLFAEDGTEEAPPQKPPNSANGTGSGTS